MYNVYVMTGAASSMEVGKLTLFIHSMFIFMQVQLHPYMLMMLEATR